MTHRPPTSRSGPYHPARPGRRTAAVGDLRVEQVVRRPSLTSVSRAGPPIARRPAATMATFRPPAGAARAMIWWWRAPARVITRSAV